MNIFAFEFRHYEDFTLLSLHATKKAAFSAMIRHKNEWFEDERKWLADPAEIGRYESWRIRPVEVDGTDREVERLRAVIRRVIAGDWCVTELQEAIGELQREVLEK
jgi:hypothetical protein